MKFYNNLKDGKIQKHYFNAVIENNYWSEINIGGSYYDKKGAHTLAITSFLIDQITYYQRTYNQPYKLQSYREIARITGIPKSTVYDIVTKLDGVLFTSNKQPYLNRDAIKNQTLTIKPELKLATRYKNQIINLEKLDELYFKKYGKQLYAFKTKWYEELRIKTKENDKVISFKTADEFIKNNNENSKEENNINIYDINKIQKEKKINWSVSVYKSVDKEMTKFMKSKRWTRANALDYILNDWFKKH